jgi:hypothetical protein
MNVRERNGWPEAPHSCTIKTLEGDHEGLPGEYIIKGVKGEIYPCKPDIFELTYEAEQERLNGNT